MLAAILLRLPTPAIAQSVSATPATPSTPFFIGSAKKAFTATLVGMLVDEGLMRWDEPTFSNEVFTISERNHRLVIDIPSQLESALNPVARRRPVVAGND